MTARGRNLPERPTNALGVYDSPLELARAVVRELPIQPDEDVLEPSVGSGNWITALHERHGPGIAPRLWAMDLDPLVPGLDLLHELGGHPIDLVDANLDAAAAEAAHARLEAAGVPRYRHGGAVAGFLAHRPPVRPRWVVGNPPYSVIDPARRCPACEGSGRSAGARAGRSKACPECHRPPRIRGDVPIGYVAERLINVSDLHVARALEVSTRHVVFVQRISYLEGRERFRSLWRLGHLRRVWTAVQRASFAFGSHDNTATAVFWWDKEWARPTFEGGWLDWDDNGEPGSSRPQNEDGAPNASGAPARTRRGRAHA